MNSSKLNSPQPAKPKSRRSDPRIARNSKVVLCCLDRQGGQRRFRASALDVSKNGILVQTEEAIPAGTVVYLQTAGFTALGKASVRHCTQKGLRFRIGLYLPDPLTRAL
jgi:hypothetical protein